MHLFFLMPAPPLLLCSAVPGFSFGRTLCSWSRFEFEFYPQSFVKGSNHKQALILTPFQSDEETGYSECQIKVESYMLAGCHGITQIASLDHFVKSMALSKTVCLTSVLSSFCNLIV